MTERSAYECDAPSCHAMLWAGDDDHGWLMASVSWFAGPPEHEAPMVYACSLGHLQAAVIHALDIDKVPMAAEPTGGYAEGGIIPRMVPKRVMMTVSAGHMDDVRDALNTVLSDRVKYRVTEVSGDAGGLAEMTVEVTPKP